MQRIFVEGYGCSHNLSDTAKLKWLVNDNFNLVEKPELADTIIFNGCTVKKATENRMFNMLGKRLLLGNIKKIIVFGCIARINAAQLKMLNSNKIIVLESLPELCHFLKLPNADFSPAMRDCLQNKIISILPISTGCLGNCSFCCVKKARGNLKSFSISDLNKKFKESLETSKEIWLCSEDTGCYGLDINVSLPLLLNKLLENDGKYRVRLGMMNPQWLERYFDGLVEIYKKEHMYKFIHLPLQSASDRILKSMRRSYSYADFSSTIKEFRRKVKPLTFSTDIIVGFPSETEHDFNETVSAIKSLKPDIVNISRYENRPYAVSSSLKGQLHGRIKKQRSRILASLCKKISFENNKKEIGKRYEVLVDEIGKNSTVVGRNIAYKPLVLKNAVLGDFIEVRVISAKSTHLNGKIAA